MLDVDSQVWMSHGDTIKSISKENQIIASTSEVKIAGFSINSENTLVYNFIQKFIILLMELKY